jgi:hypothetical protein
VDNIIGNDRESLKKAILTFPGEAISAQIILRKHRKFKALEVSTEMKNLSKRPNEEQYVGQFKKVARKTDVFYKADFETCDQEFLQSIVIKERMYRSNGQTSMPTCTINLQHLASEHLNNGMNTIEIFSQRNLTKCNFVFDCVHCMTNILRFMCSFTPTAFPLRVLGVL